ncbi:hypothetical protein WJX73_000062 [Symbiochloris irregularis]|uniref:Uncharacterized protein n=1 Tax=Symbiochloris irregularis TaxID=706552 RepID=A0AAW1PB76_9CHLO
MSVRPGAIVKLLGRKHASLIRWIEARVNGIELLKVTCQCCAEKDECIGHRTCLAGFLGGLRALPVTVSLIIECHSHEQLFITDRKGPMTWLPNQLVSLTVTCAMKTWDLVRLSTFTALRELSVFMVNTTPLEPDAATKDNDVCSISPRR